jgi:hypothetical protein
MPCDMTTSMSIEWGENTIVDLLAKALADQGLTETINNENNLQYAGNGNVVTYNKTNHKMTIRSSGYYTKTLDERELKRAYSTELVKNAAQRFGWNLKQQSPTVFRAQRRF